MWSTLTSSYISLVLLLCAINTYSQSGNFHDAAFALEIVENSPFSEVYSVTRDDYGSTYVFGKIQDEKKLLRYTLDQEESMGSNWDETSQVFYKEHHLLLFDKQRVIKKFNLISNTFEKNDTLIETPSAYIVNPQIRYFGKKGPINAPYKVIEDFVNKKKYIVAGKSIYIIKSSTLTDYRILDSITYHIRIAYPIDNDVLVGFRASKRLYLDKGDTTINICALEINKNNKPAQYYHASRYKNKIYLTDNNDEASLLNLNDYSIRPIEQLNRLDKELKNNVGLKDGTMLFGSIDGDVIHYDSKHDKIIHIYKTELSNTFRFYEDKNGFIWVGYSNGLAIIDRKNRKMHVAPPIIDGVNLSSIQISGITEYENTILLSAYNKGIYSCRTIEELISDKNTLDWEKLNIKISEKFSAFKELGIHHLKTSGSKLIIKTKGNIHIFDQENYELLNQETGYNGVMQNFFPHYFDNQDLSLPILNGYLRLRVDKNLNDRPNRYSIFSLSKGEEHYSNLYKINTQGKIQVGEEYSYLSIELLDEKTHKIIDKSVYIVNEKDSITTTDKRIIFANKKIQTHNVSIHPFTEILPSKQHYDIQIKITRKWYKSWWFRIIILVLLIGIGIFIMRLLQHTKSQKRKIKSLETESLRSYMNPHFISNSLNSINYYILKNDKETASSYIVKFSKLIRRILSNSDQEFISLSQEIEAIKMYIEIEQMRFIDKFNYEIKIDKQLNQTLEIPSFIIQPIVENAIWHGLIQKTEQGKLLIDISQKEHRINISVIDDGIGMKKSKELKSKSVTKRKSYGMQLIRKRLTILNDLYNHNHEILIINREKQGKKGTQVDILLSPLQHKKQSHE